MRNGKNEILRKSIHQRESQFFVIVFSEKRIAGNVIEHIVRPAHIPLEVEAEPAFVGGRGDHRPCSRFLRDHQNIAELSEYGGIQFSEKRYGFEVFVLPVYVRDPFTRFAVVIKIKHGSDSVCSQPVEMKLTKPI